MARFRFELEAVLRQRVRVEQTRQVAMAAIDRERIELEDQLRRVQATIDGERAELRNRLGDGSGGFAPVREQVRAITALDHRGRALAVRLAEVFARLEVSRGELVAAAGDRRAIELLRERRYKQWRADLLRREQLELDELASRVGMTGA